MAYLNISKQLLGLLLSLLFLSSCAVQKPESVDIQNSILPVADNNNIPGVIIQLVKQADKQYYQQNFSGALSTLERALRINPRHAEIWSRMAQVCLKQGRAEQAKQYARRSNSYIKNNTQLLEFNNQLIYSAGQGPLN